MLTAKGYALVRRGTLDAPRGGAEWLDADTFADSVDGCVASANMDEQIMGPVWTAANPRVRYVQCELTAADDAPSIPA